MNLKYKIKREYTFQFKSVYFQEIKQQSKEQVTFILQEQVTLVSRKA